MDSPRPNWGLSTFDHFEGECGTWAIGAFRSGHRMRSATTSATGAE